MSHKQLLIKGTLLLTLTGFATRFMGFFYRMFLSHTFGEEGMGLYQLIFPIYAMGFSLTCAGIELNLSRLVSKKTALGQKKEALELLYVSLCITVGFSCIFMILLQRNAEWIAVQILHDARCYELLLILSYVFPFASIHSCICGYYFGLKAPGIPAKSQLIEQTVRISSVWLICWCCTKMNLTPGIPVAAAGLITGEAASSFYVVRLLLKGTSPRIAAPSSLRAAAGHIRELLLPSIPLTANRVLLNILQSIEAISIPLSLQAFGMTPGESLSLYGVLTGMALPCILFPSAISNSISTMLLPTVAEIQALDRGRQLSDLIRKVTLSCIFMGTMCCAALLITGRWIGAFLFHSQLAGYLIVTLAWICPFLYTNNTLISILNGIGKTAQSFLINSLSLGLRIASIFFLIPDMGIRGYLTGMLASQIFVSGFCLLILNRYIRRRPPL